MSASKARRTFAVLVMAGALALVAGACGGDPSNGSPAATGDPAAPSGDLGDAMELALRAADAHPAVPFEPYRVTDAVPDRPEVGGREVFADHAFVYVWSALGHTENAPFAVSPEGTAFRLPDEFDELARDAGLALESEEDAAAILRFFLDFHSVLPGADYLVILDDVTDVPGIDEREAARLVDAVGPPVITPGPDGWTFAFNSWSAVGGQLQSWRVDVARTGEIAVRERQTLDDGLGDAVTIE